MKLQKKHYVMLAIGIVLIIIAFLVFRKKKGSESGYDSSLLIPGAGESNFKTGGDRCACASGNETGICVKNNGVLSCQKSVLLPSGGGAANARTAADPKKSTKPTCPGGTVLSDCYRPDGSSYKCCAASNA